MGAGESREVEGGCGEERERGPKRIRMPCSLVGDVERRSEMKRAVLFLRREAVGFRGCSWGTGVGGS